MNDDFFLELQDGFLQEAQDLLGKVEALSLNLEKNRNSVETFAELARLAHNFKGSGKAVGFEHISKLGHRLEDYILAIKNGFIPSTSQQLDFLFRCLDRLKSDIDTLVLDKAAKLDHSEIFNEIDLRLANPFYGEDKPESDVDSVHMPSPEQFEEVSAPLAESDVQTDPMPDEIVLNKNEVSNVISQTATVKNIDEVSSASQTKKSNELEKHEATIPMKSKPVEVLRIQKPKIDYLLEAFGEQVILQSTLDQCKFDIDAKKDLLVKTINQLTKLTFELQSHALSLTMVQLGPVFTKLERAVRDAARMCEKSVDVITIGSETEVDKTLIDSLSDALTHMVRNSVDHAIESSDERISLGKAPTGTVQIVAKRTGGQLWIQIIDDGKGLDSEVIKNKAVQKGIITSARASQMTDQESFYLIFSNGFSTKDVVSEVSGRGVGMNVVEESVLSLKGTIDIQSEKGKGTCFTLKLPLSLAIFNGAVVRVQNSKFVVPSSEISEIGRICIRDQISLNAKTAAIQIRGEVFEIVDLTTKLGLKRQSKDEMLPALLTRKFGNKAFLVDEVLGIQKIVQKPLGDEVKSKKEYAAGTILGDGSPGVILNLQVLSESA